MVKFFTRERVSLLDESMNGTFRPHDQSFSTHLHHADNVVEFHTRQTEYKRFGSSHNASEVDLFTGMTTVLIYASTSKPSGLSITFRTRFRSQLPSSSQMQIAIAAGHTPVRLPVSKPPMQADRNEPMELSPTARELEGTLQNGTNSPFI